MAALLMEDFVVPAKPAMSERLKVTISKVIGRLCSFTSLT